MPPKGYTTGNDKLLQVKITPQEHRELMQLASHRHTTVSNLVRDYLRKMLSSNNATAA